MRNRTLRLNTRLDLESMTYPPLYPGDAEHAGGQATNTRTAICPWLMSLAQALLVFIPTLSGMARSSTRSQEVSAFRRRRWCAER